MGGCPLENLYKTMEHHRFSWVIWVNQRELDGHVQEQTVGLLGGPFFLMGLANNLWNLLDI